MDDITNRTSHIHSFRFVEIYKRLKFLNHGFWIEAVESLMGGWYLRSRRRNCEMATT
jgi:hypothetical protein